MLDWSERNSLRWKNTKMDSIFFYWHQINGVADFLIRICKFFSSPREPFSLDACMTRFREFYHEREISVYFFHNAYLSS